jgi:hypothetical protein
MASPAHWNAKLKAVPASVTDPAERQPGLFGECIEHRSESPNKDD